MEGTKDLGKKKNIGKKKSRRSRESDNETLWSNGKFTTPLWRRRQVQARGSRSLARSSKLKGEGIIKKNGIH